MLAQQGATVLVHGRSKLKVQRTLRELRAHTGQQNIYGYVADFSSLQQTRQLGENLRRDLVQHFDGRCGCRVPAFVVTLPFPCRCCRSPC